MVEVKRIEDMLEILDANIAMQWYQEIKQLKGIQLKI